MDVAHKHAGIYNQGKTAVFPPIIWPLIILLIAAGLRLVALDGVPPGLTHDEADHGITAWSIVNGVRALYFTIGYGREPLYDYATAILMQIMGPTYLAGRLTAVFFSLLLVATLYRWTRTAYSQSTALLTSFALATSFWPLMTGRQALRSTLLPTIFALAVLFFWHGLRQLDQQRQPWLAFGTAGLLLGVSFYIYIPARILWAVLPTTAVYLTLSQRQPLAKLWAGLLGSLLLALLLATPLLLYLRTHPGTEVRIDELQAPLTAVRDSNWQPLLNNISGSLRLFTHEGDPTARYNIPGRPLLTPLMGFLFYLGLITAVYQLTRPRHRQLASTATASFLALTWLLAGLSPVLVTGPEWAMTQAIGMQPVLYLFPALGLTALARLGVGQWQQTGWLILLLLWGGTAVNAANDYFNQWANNPHVRVQYESTMIAAMNYLNQHGDGHVAISTITPAAPHTPALAQMTLHNPAIIPHWFNANSSLLIPSSPRSQLILPGFAPLAAGLAPYFTAQPLMTLPLRASDLDQPLDLYQLDRATLVSQADTLFTPPTANIRFGQALTLLGYHLQTPQAKAGERLRLATLWQIDNALPQAQLFTHLLGNDGNPVAQADQLGVPGESWQAGDLFIQLHEIWLPAELAAGSYPLAVGLYTTDSGVRQPLLVNGAPQGDSYLLPALQVVK